MISHKMDGLSRGGTVFQLHEELKVPIWFLGVGEKKKDLQHFDSEIFIQELFDQEASAS